MVRNSPPAGTVTRRQREREQRRQAILIAARHLFVAKGVAATTMDDVAQACQLAKGTLYLYFNTKDEIAFALLLQATDDLLAALRDSLDTSAPAVDQLERLALTYYRFFQAQPESFRYMFIVPHESYAGQVSEELLERWAASGRAALRLVAGLLERAAAEGDLSVEDPWSTAVALWSTITGVIVIPSQQVRRPFVGDVHVERLVVQTVRWLLRGLSPGGRTGKG
jgi:AcrR family transcriptional regulator